MMRSARYSFSSGRTAHRPQPDKAEAKPIKDTANKIFMFVCSSSEVDGQAAGVLLAVGSGVGGEEGVVAEVEAEGEALAEDQHGAAAGVQRELRRRGLRDAVHLRQRGRAADAEREEGDERAARPHEDVAAGAVDDQRAVLADRFADVSLDGKVVVDDERRAEDEHPVAAERAAAE